MKILQLHYSLRIGGAERFVVDITNELSINHDVTLCTIEDDTNKKAPKSKKHLDSSYYKKELNSQVKYINLGCGRGQSLKALWKIFRMLMNLKPDIVHIHTEIATILLPSLFLRKTVFFQTLHSLAERYLKSKFLKDLYRWYYRKKIRAVTISKVCQDSFVDLYNLSNSLLIDNGRAASKKTDQFDSVSKEVKDFKIHDNDLVFIHAARCSPEKNQEMLVKAFNQLLQEGHHIILIIIGSNYDKRLDGRLIKEALKGIYFLGLKSNVGDYLYNADLFMLSSLTEGQPLSLLEALSCGVIPVCTPAGGIKDVIKNKKLGFISTSFELNDYLDTIREAINSFSQFDKNHLVEYFMDNYTMKKCANKYVKQFQRAYNSSN